MACKMRQVKGNALRVRSPRNVYLRSRVVVLTMYEMGASALVDA